MASIFKSVPFPRHGKWQLSHKYSNLGSSFFNWYISRYYSVFSNVGLLLLSYWRRKQESSKAETVVSCSSSTTPWPVNWCPGHTSAFSLLCSPQHSIQHMFNHPVLLIKSQRSLTEAVLLSFGSTNIFPKTLYRWRANASQQQIIRCPISVSILQDQHDGWPSNRPIIYRCLLTEAFPVRIATTICTWCLLNLSRSVGSSETYVNSYQYLRCHPRTQYSSIVVIFTECFSSLLHSYTFSLQYEACMWLWTYLDW